MIEGVFPKWLVVLQGIIAILFGAILLIWPFEGTLFLAFFLGFFLIINSVLYLIMGASAEDSKTRVISIIIGILGIIIGFLALVYPFAIIFAVELIFAIWVLVYGFGNLGVAVFTGGKGKLLLGILGVISILFGGIVLGMLIQLPILTSFVLIQVLGIYALIMGILSLLIGITAKEDIVATE